ncbi:pollen-specific leucine-rich repeat extensin-like protein 1 [Syzygium oleosum]|uniref:pollen-specific leucine-rich repeat extensin-like protein 1 n=1 Tax=Syzygium oleosum TaxID=219896 RepID=UPI0011D1EB28|nr:pollen-specific leucine-rich repeat extensin-like protein 1 [Syzygium oleosum]
MASGSSGRPSSGFDFATDDILCSYEDYGGGGGGHQQDASNGGSHSDSAAIGAANLGKDFHKSRLVRPIVYSASAYSQPEDSFNQDLIASVEKSMKKHTDNLMRFLEGISSRLSELELYCYNLDKSIGEMRSQLNRDHGDADTKLKSLDKHLQEVHRSVQILRDKQELAETQKELAKLQLVQKESSSGHDKSNEEKTSTPKSDSKKSDNASDVPDQQLALALPHQVSPPQPPVAPPSQAPAQNVSQQQAYYLQPGQIPNTSVPAQLPQSQYVASDPHVRMSQLQVAPQSMQPQVNQTPAPPPPHPFPQYQQQWSQQLPQQVQPQQQSSMQPQIRAPSPAVYSPYPPSQPSNPPPETLPNSMAMQLSYSGVPPPVSSRVDTVSYEYGGQGRMGQQQPPLPPPKGTFGAHPGETYQAGPQSVVPQTSGYMMYEGDMARAHHAPQQMHFPQGAYPPTNVPVQNPHAAPGGNLVGRNPGHSQFVRNHPYGELIEKLVSMGFRGDHVASVIQRLEESGQPVDFNAVLDRLNVHSSGNSQRGWSA